MASLNITRLFSRMKLLQKPEQLEQRESPWGLKELNPGQEPVLDLVAVHGLNGHREKTWTAENGVIWLKDLLPAQLPHARILTYGYDSRTHGLDELSHQNISHHGINLLSSLCLLREKTKTIERPIIFIAHSLGGLVLKSALIHSNLANKTHNKSHRALKLSTYGILFCGTPHQGGNGVPWAKLAMRIMSIYANTSTYALTQLEVHSEWLNDQLEQFKSISSDFDTIFFYEGYATPLRRGTSILIVPLWSAVVPGAVNAEVVEIRKNHRAMVQFSSATDNDFLTIAMHISIMSEKASAKVKSNWKEWGDNTGYAKPIEAIIEPHDILGSLLTDQSNYRVKFVLPYRRNEIFIGREDIFGQLNSILSEDNVKQTAVLYGIGGIGKTQIALHYAHKETANISSVLWLNATTLTSIQQSFLQLAQQLIDHYIQLVASSHPPYGRVAGILGLKGLVDDEGRVKHNIQVPDSVANAIIAWLSLPSNRNWLVIYDNYDDPESFALGKYIPSSHAGKIIVTSRRRDCARLGRGVEVGSLSTREGVQLLLQSCQVFSDISQEEEDEATRIVEKLECLPLAIDHAGGYIFTEMITLKAYLPRFECNTKKVLNRSLPPFGLDNDRDPVFMSWDTSFEAIERVDPVAVAILTYCSFYSNVDIAMNIFAGEAKTDVETHVARLFSYSFVRREGTNSITIHPLVHAWARERLDPEAKRTACEVAFEMLINTARIPEDSHSRTTEQWALERRLLPHIDTALKWSTSFGAFEDSSEQKFAVWNDCACVYTLHNRYSDAEGLYSHVLKGRKQSLGEDHLETARTKLGLARLYRLDARNEEASQLFEQCVQVFETELGKGSLESCQTFRGLAISRKQQDRFIEARDLLERAISAYASILGPHHPETLAAHESLALVHQRLGLNEYALDSIERVLLSNMQNLRSKHPNTLRNMLNKALILGELGRLDQAKAILEQAFTDAETQFGPLDQFTLKVVHNLAFITFRQGQYGEAEPLCELAIAGWEKTKGKTHVLTMNSIELLGVVYHRLGSHGKAEVLLETALSGYRALDGSCGLVAIYRVLDYIAQVYASRDEVINAKKYYQQALDGHNELLGPKNQATVNIARGFAAFCESRGWEADAKFLREKYISASL